MGSCYLDEECQCCQATGGLQRLSQIQILPLVHYVHLTRDTAAVGDHICTCVQEKRENLAVKMKGFSA